jgi:hypothetical protein
MRRDRNRCPNMPSVRLRKDWISTAGKCLCITAARKISLTSRRSFVGKPTESRWKQRRRRAAGGGPAPLGAVRRISAKGLIWLKIYDPPQVCSRQVPELFFGIRATVEPDCFWRTGDNSAARTR